MSNPSAPTSIAVPLQTLLADPWSVFYEVYDRINQIYISDPLRAADLEDADLTPQAYRRGESSNLVCRIAFSTAEACVTFVWETDGVLHTSQWGLDHDFDPSTNQVVVRVDFGFDWMEG